MCNAVKLRARSSILLRMRRQRAKESVTSNRLGIAFMGVQISSKEELLIYQVSKFCCKRETLQSNIFNTYCLVMRNGFTQCLFKICSHKYYNYTFGHSWI